MNTPRRGERKSDSMGPPPLSPLRGFDERFRGAVPGLTPWTNLCRPSRANLYRASRAHKPRRRLADRCCFGADGSDFRKASGLKPVLHAGVDQVGVVVVVSPRGRLAIAEESVFERHADAL